jgi:hypothetical protein
MRYACVGAALALSLIGPRLGGAADPDDPFKALAFLEGTWEAKTTGGSATAQGSGSYTFVRELRGHVLARHTDRAKGCRGPKEFDCEHSDLLYVFQESPEQPLKAIYFDNEGHVIHYEVATPDAGTAVFSSSASAAGPRFRLRYQRTGLILSGQFMMQMPGTNTWMTYLQWSGPKK